METRGAQLAVWVGVIGLALSACTRSGDGGAAPGPPERLDEPLEAIAAAHADAGSYQFELDTDLFGGFTSSGAVEYNQDDLSRPDLTIETVVSASTGELRDVTILIADGQPYARARSELDLPPGIEWLSFDMSGDNPLAQFARDVVGVRLHAEVGWFHERSDIITVAHGGTDVVDGVEVLEYVLTLDAAELHFSELPVPGFCCFDPTYAVWVDGRGLARQVTADFGEFGTLQMRLSRFGDPTGIEVPPADRVADLESLLR